MRGRHLHDHQLTGSVFGPIDASSESTPKRIAVVRARHENGHAGIFSQRNRVQKRDGIRPAEQGVMGQVVLEMISDTALNSGLRLNDFPS